MKLRIFKVNINNYPGAWKQGEDPYKLVIAENKDAAIGKIKTDWGENWEYKAEQNDGIPKIKYLKGGSRDITPTSSTEFSVKEIEFPDYDVHIRTPRKAKLERINKRNGNLE